MSQVPTFSIKNTTKGRLPSLPFARIKDSVLGPQYTLSFAIVGVRASRRLNRTYRNKDAPTDVLSFSLEKNVGEIVINPDIARRKAKAFGRSYENYIGFIFIHGLYHLKGYDHGDAMERAEAKTRAVFNI